MECQSKICFKKWAWYLEVLYMCKMRDSSRPANLPLNKWNFRKTYKNLLGQIIVSQGLQELRFCSW